MDMDKEFSNCTVYVDDKGDLFMCDGYLVVEDPNGNVVPVKDTEEVRNYFLQKIAAKSLHNHPDCPAPSSQNPTPKSVPSDSTLSIQDLGDETAQVSRKDRLRWSNAATLLLLELWRQRRSRFENNTERNEILWEEISNKMKENGYQFSGGQIENRFKYLKKTYIECVDKNRKSTGRPEKTCSYYEELHELFHKSPQINPPSLVASRQAPEQTESSTAEQTESSTAEQTESSTAEQTGTSSHTHAAAAQADPDQAGPLRSRRPRTRMERSVGLWADEFNRQAREREAARVQRHEEILTLLHESNRDFVSLMNRLLDKF